jgi:hypothetical protein
VADVELDHFPEIEPVTHAHVTGCRPRAIQARTTDEAVEPRICHNGSSIG